MKIAFSKIGTYPLQAIIEQTTDNFEKKLIIFSIKNHILQLSEDCFGTHVVEKIITCYDQSSIQFIYDMIIYNFLYLANHMNGLCVVKKAIIHASTQETIDIFKNLIINNFIKLVQNPYGNYAIQVAFDVK